jgi:YD repeat-containing protein
MKKTLLLVIIATLSTCILLSCGKEDELANPKGSTNPNGNPGNPSEKSKCYITELRTSEKGETHTTTFTYNAKNLLESKNDDDGKTTYEYDANNRITKMNLNSLGVETFTYEYDSKGTMTKIKYDEKDAELSIDISEYILSTNAKGQVDKVQGVTSDGPLNFLLEYDAKGNITKVIMDDEGDKYTLIQNLKFDDKSNVYLNLNLAKAHIPHVIVGALFGVNTTFLVNINNVLSDTVISFIFGDVVNTTYDYGYTTEGFPSKMTSQSKVSGETQKTEETYIYTCK